jgi:hypothetical protein
MIAVISFNKSITIIVNLHAAKVGMVLEAFKEEGGGGGATKQNKTSNVGKFVYNQ